MLEEFQDFIEKNQLFEPGARILLAVSGGMDSMVMMHLFRKAGLSYGVAHCNFSLRVPDCDGDEYFVKEISQGQGVDFFCRHFETEAYAREKSISIQMAARELRYHFFEEVADKYGYTVIATAHHADDAVETFFINLFRGSGLSGLQGIPMSNGRIRRPLLFAHREQIENYAKENKIAFREDLSNQEEKYLRNKIRLRLIPLLKELNPQFLNGMEDSFHRIAQSVEALDALCEEKKALITFREDDSLILDPRLLHEQAAKSFILFKILEPYGFQEDTILRLLDAKGLQAGKIFYSASHRLLIDRQRWIIKPLENSGDELFAVLEIKEMERSIFGPPAMDIEYLDDRSGFEIPEDNAIACLDMDKLQFPLQIRPWKNGDVFYPLGARGKKKLSDFFSDQKFTRFEKEECRLLCSGEDIVWVIGRRIAQQYRVTSQTKRVMMLKLKQIHS